MPLQAETKVGRPGLQGWPTGCRPTARSDCLSIPKTFKGLEKTLHMVCMICFPCPSKDVNCRILLYLLTL